MSSLQTWMLRMHLLDVSSPYRPVNRRRRFSSSTSAIQYVGVGDPNNNHHHNNGNGHYDLPPVVNPSRKRRRVPAFVYQRSDESDETLSQLAVHSFEGFRVKLRSEQPIPVSVERFLTSFGCATSGCETAPSVISGMYVTPHMVPVSCASTAHFCYDTATNTGTMVYRNTVEFRPRYLPVAGQTVNEERQEVDRDPPHYVSHACWLVPEFGETN